jgi:hypothetical protein
MDRKRQEAAYMSQMTLAQLSRVPGLKRFQLQDSADLFTVNFSEIQKSSANPRQGLLSDAS